MTEGSFREKDRVAGENETKLLDPAERVVASASVVPVAALPEACYEIIRTNADPELREDAAVHLLKLIDDGKEVDEILVKDLWRGEKDQSVRNKLRRVTNKLGFRKLLDHDPTAYYDPKLTPGEEVKLYEAIGRLRTVYDKSKEKPGAFDEKYVVFDMEIGKGGMARILKGMRRSDSRPVAFKYLMLEKLERYATAKTLTALFRNEGKLLTERFDHPNVVKGFDYGVADGDYYIVLEYIEGGSLYDVIRKTPYGIGRFRETARLILSALEYIHKERVIHRDINPRNIMVDHSSSPVGLKIIDFGLALDKTGGFMPPPGFRGYNVPYTSPQQREDFNDVDERDDIYSLGVVFYEMLGGRVEGDGITREMVAPFPETMSRVIGRCIEKEREKRFKDISEVKRGLFG